MSDDLLLIVDDAIELLRDPENGIVSRFSDFITDAEDKAVHPGDPDACRFCAAGVVRHAAQLVRHPGEVRLSYFSLVLSDEEEEVIAGDHGTLISMFQVAWNSGIVEQEEADDYVFHPEIVRRNLIRLLQFQRKRLERGEHLEATT